MTLAQYFEDFVKLLNKHQVDYMLVGGHSLALNKALVKGKILENHWNYQ
jgi:hypothetical protein